MGRSNPAAEPPRAPRRHDSLPPVAGPLAAPIEPCRAYAQTDIHPGDTVAGRYRVNAILGRARGLLLEASHTGFAQRVAIRVLSPALVEPKAVARFEAEARILAQLESDHAARIFDFGRLRDGSLYLVREYIEGPSVAAQARARGGLPLDEAVLVFLQICEAVQEAHSRGVVLRDLRGSHVFSSARRSGPALAKLTDFGTCKIVREGAGGERTATKLLGLSSSAAPELVRQDKVIDARADVWSLGCILYELLTGRPTFSGDGVALMISISSDEPAPLGRVRPYLPSALDAILRWALAKDRERRFPSVYAFAHELRPFADARGQLLIDAIGRLAHGAQPPPLAPPVAEAMGDDDELTIVRARPRREPVAAVAQPIAAPPTPLAPPVPVRPQPIAAPPTPLAPPVPVRPVVLSPPSFADDPHADQPSLRSGDFPCSTDVVRVPSRHRGAALAVWATIAAMPLMALALTLVLSQPTEVAAAQPHLASGISAEIDAHAALAAMDPKRDAGGDELEGAVTALVRQEHAAREPTAEPPPVRSPASVEKAEPEREVASSAQGTLVAMAVGGRCAFAVDGAARGAGSSIKAKVAAGEHRVTCKPAAGALRTRTVRVEPGKAAVAVFRF